MFCCSPNPGLGLWPSVVTALARALAPQHSCPFLFSFTTCRSLSRRPSCVCYTHTSWACRGKNAYPFPSHSTQSSRSLPPLKGATHRDAHTLLASTLLNVTLATSTHVTPHYLLSVTGRPPPCSSLFLFIPSSLLVTASCYFLSPSSSALLLAHHCLAPLRLTTFALLEFGLRFVFGLSFGFGLGLR